MKKIILTILVCWFMVLGLVGCDDTVPLKTDKEEIQTFNATIIKCEQKSMIVMPDKGEIEYKSSNKFRIEFVGDFKTCNVNDKVRITYIGYINESYPAQIGTTKIEIIK